MEYDEDADIELISLGNIRPEGVNTLPPEANEVMGLGEGNFVIVTDLFWGSVRVFCRS